MSGYLEQLVTKVQELELGFKALEARVNAMGSGAAGAQVAQTTAAPANMFAAQPAAQVAVAAANPFATAQAAQPAATAITAEALVALITPYVEIEAVKNVLFDQMKTMGINALGETRPDQYAELHAKFQHVINQYKEATGQTGAAVAGAASII